MRPWAAAVLLAATLAAQDDPLRELAGRARGAPPEFAADLLLLLAGRSELSAEGRIQLLEDAYRLAESARRKVPVSANSSLFPSNAAAQTSFLLGPHPGLDVLTLQSRAVQALLPLDRAQAMILFRAIQMVEAAASSACDTAFDLGIHYSTAEAVYKQGFTPEERAEGRDLDFLIATVYGLRSPKGIDETLNFFRLPLDDAAFLRLLNAFTTALSAMPRGDLGSGFSISFTNRLIRVIDDAQGRKISVFPLLAAVREFLVRNLSGSRCADSLPPGATMAQEATWFNDTLLVYGGLDTTQLRPIEPSEVQPAETRELRVNRPSPQAAKLTDALKTVSARPTEDRRLPQFEEAVRDLLRRVDQWRRDHTDPEASYVRLASDIYRQLAPVIDSDALRRTVLREHLDLLRRTPLRDEDPQLWAAEMDSLINRVRVYDVDFEWFREELRTSGEPVMPLYLECYELLARPQFVVRKPAP